MLLELERFINKDSYTIDWKKEAYKKLCFVGLTDEHILYLLKGHILCKNSCKKWCEEHIYPCDKVWEVIK